MNAFSKIKLCINNQTPLAKSMKISYNKKPSIERITKFNTYDIFNTSFSEVTKIIN